MSDEQHQYDAAGDRTRLWPDSFCVTDSYDALNRITDVLQSGSSSLAHYTYDAASRRAALTYGNTGPSAIRRRPPRCRPAGRYQEPSAHCVSRQVGARRSNHPVRPMSFAQA